MKFSEMCEANFGTKDLYEILNVSRQASEKDVRKAYYKMSLSYHPDRVEENQKKEATEKFKLISKIHSILSDPEKRTIYDDFGLLDEEDDRPPSGDSDWMDYWRVLFKKVTLDDINKYEKEYKGSEEELNDLKKAYENCKGDMDKIFEYILFSTSDDEERIRARLQLLIDSSEIPAYEAFINEPMTKRDRRMRKLRKEAKEAKKMEEEDESRLEALHKAILARREESTEDYLSALEKKYAGPKSTDKTKKKSSKK